MKASADKSRRRAALALAGLAFGVSAPLFYVVQRLYEAARGQAIDPASILRQAHTSFYYRALAAVWFAALIAALVYRSSRNEDADAERRARQLGLLALIVLPLCSIAAWLVP
jgi:Na+/phosphate symporter